MQTFIFIVIALLSVILYIYAPYSYSWSYCALCAVIYIINATIGLIPVMKKNLICFSFFFSLTLFFCSFLFPLVIYPVDRSYSLFSFGYNANVITKCTALVLFAHSIYWVGHVRGANLVFSKFFFSNAQITDKTINKFTILVSFAFVAFISLGGLTYFTDRYIGGVMSINLAFQYLNVFFSTIVVTLACMLVYAKKKATFLMACVILGVITITILNTGSRTIPLYIILPLLYVVKNRFKLSTLTLVWIMLVILVAFASIGIIRNQEITIDSLLTFDSSTKQFGYIENLSDFIINNRNLYAIYDYVENNDILYGVNFLGALLSTIPFAQSFVSGFFGIPAYEFSSDTFCTHLVFGANPPLGLGTHVVGDVYLATGIIGLIVLFYFLGFFMSKLSNSIKYNRCHFMQITYLFILSYSIFMCRGSFLGPIKGIIWAGFFIYLINRFTLNSRN